MFPKTLLARTFLLIAALILLAMGVWVALFSHYEREPRARQLSQTLVSVVNLSRAALLSARPEARHQLLADMSSREGIHIYPAEPGDRIGPLLERGPMRRIAALVQEQLGPQTLVTLELDGEPGIFISFHVDDSAEGAYWLALPLERLDRNVTYQWLGWGLLAMSFALFGAWLIAYQLARQLKSLACAADAIGAGRHPDAVTPKGPQEIRSLTAAFNQMNEELKQSDRDRRLVLAGISHDLRTPLARLRIGIEMAAADTETRDGMVADVEEMDRTIGQFLDFAKVQEEGDTAPVAGVEEQFALMQGVVESYQRRGYSVQLHQQGFARTPLPQADLRRVLVNLIENALRYAGAQSAVAVDVSHPPGVSAIEVLDRGPGIPEAEAARLLRPFTRMEHARTNSGGAGLGLAIVNRIVSGRGGRILLLNREGGGLVARVELPAA